MSDPLAPNHVKRFTPSFAPAMNSIGLGLALIVFACASVHAGCEPKTSQEAHADQEDGAENNYGTYNKEPAAKKSGVRDQERKPNPDAFIERDPSETREGSGPDPFGRY